MVSPISTKAVCSPVRRSLGFGSVDDDVETIDVETDWTAPGIMSIAGRHRLEVPTMAAVADAISAVS
jgi:hypothetical protein